jgi:hypothetical protein
MSIPIFKDFDKAANGEQSKKTRLDVVNPRRRKLLLTKSDLESKDINLNH